MVAWLVRILLILIIVAGVAVPGGLFAQDPTYDVPGRFALPWACGEGYVVTWDPTGHWAEGKATGLAYDFSMPEGTPLYSPGHGHIYYLKDERPFETNLGNYVEIVIEEDWLVRLAHLRDPRSGEGPVRAGEFIGYSGCTGVPLAHLHMELFVRDGSRWIAPSPEQLETLFGLPVADLVEGAVVANDGCPAKLALNGPVLPRAPSARLGEPIDLLVPLRNDGLESISIDVLQVSLTAPDGDPMVARAEGEWFLDAKAEAEVTVAVFPPRAGEWAVGRVTCGAGEATFALPGEGAFLVEPSDLRLVGVSVPPEVRTGERIVLEAWVENGGDEDLRVNELEVRGVQPDGLPWSAVARQARTIRAGQARRFDLEGVTLPERVGEWRLTAVGYRDGHIACDGCPLQFAVAERNFDVVGPELRAESLTARLEEGRLSVSLLLENVGTEAAVMDRIEVWGWKPGGEEAFTLEARVDPLAPGASILVRMEAPLGEGEGLWRLVEAGYWVDGTYMRVRLPDQPTVAAMETSPESPASGVGDALEAYPAP
jgi:hypothetical protein